MRQIRLKERDQTARTPSAAY